MRNLLAGIAVHHVEHLPPVRLRPDAGLRGLLLRCVPTGLCHACHRHRSGDHQRDGSLLHGVLHRGLLASKRAAGSEPAVHPLQQRRLRDRRLRVRRFDGELAAGAERHGRAREAPHRRQGHAGLAIRDLHRGPVAGPRELVRGGRAAGESAERRAATQSPANSEFGCGLQPSHPCSARGAAGGRAGQDLPGTASQAQRLQAVAGGSAGHRSRGVWGHHAGLARAFRGQLRGVPGRL
mmetsp:Transcript_106012/g.253002  ORF Transcript_106012/g.253002 Transcript_106012/m.253002 type:complete len:237 (-) Transcript_106012:1253-1963(-)